MLPCAPAQDRVLTFRFPARTSEDAVLDVFAVSPTRTLAIWLNSVNGSICCEHRSENEKQKNWKRARCKRKLYAKKKIDPRHLICHGSKTNRLSRGLT